MARRERLVAVVLALALIGFGPVQPIMAQSNPWDNRAAVTQFTNNFLTTYNFMVSQFHLANPNLTISGHFLLYHTIGYSFNVTVLRLDDNDTRYICFAFVPIQSNTPLISIDDNETAQSRYFPNLPGLRPNNSLGAELRQGLFTGTSGSGYLPFIWIANASRLLANPSLYSAQVAQYVFDDDSRSYPPPPTLAWYSPIEKWLGTFWWVVFVVGGAVVSLVTGLHYWRNEMWPFHRSGTPKKVKHKPKLN
ncbi:MAG: hypothetical protein LYZ70_05255 [Nitrososphaerales archaeon]|nr:hypothetical protein [Nitrososphaerales archaeon]